MRGILRMALIGCVVLGSVSVADEAQATPGTAVTARTVWRWTVDDTDYLLREITIAPGGSTGWHRHPGLVFGNVREGTLTHQLSDCTTRHRYTAGESLMEDPDEPRSHVGRNEGSGPLILDVVYATPHGKPISLDVPDPGC
ncbi:cupin domain-containing protein [Actinoplanes regularis]|uniref:Cupin domain protein n=1 Tax=Actinoplanes regularis TaxID=52697 RepID=A0A238W7Z1_9ACTN|nr:cupin domain-containing protein [Actinoplanes regularis]GIE85186.1 cupin [Actinoplanes regularis]GLW27375.1 cupin [Actinoplanes regularis]SNR42521.1 Cupin domain protein [Actinoplanes regularis]